MIRRSLRSPRIQGIALGVVAAAEAVAVPPPNDSCLSAIEHAIPSGGGVVTGTVAEAANDGAGCGSNRLPAPDVYHTFIPATRGPWRLDLCDTASAWDTVLSIHRHPTNPGSPACPTTPANRIVGGCDDDGCSVFFGEVPSTIRAVSLEPGVMYTIRVAGFDGATFTDTYQLAVTDLGLPNDHCGDADLSPIGGAGGMVFGDLTNATTDGAIDAATCLGSPRSGSVRDVYHRFTPQSSGRWTFTTCITGANSTADTVLSVHSGCPVTSANALACNNDGCEVLPGSSVVSVDLVGGVPYTVRVAEYLRDRFDALLGMPMYALSVTSEPTGRCCVSGLGLCQVVAQSACGAGNSFTPGLACAPMTSGAEGSCPAGAFNDCAQSVVLSADVPVVASTSGLTGTAIGSCTPLTGDGWFTFTAPQNGDYQLFAEPQFGFIGLLTSVYPGAACPSSSATELDCGFTLGDGPKFTLAAGASVKIRVASTSPTRFTIRVSLAADAPPANDLCPQAATITRNVTASGTFTGASGGLPIDSCSSGRRDVWFSFVAPSSTRTRVVVTPAPESGITAALSISTTCAGASTPFACVGEPFTPDRPTDITFPATAGTNYRICVSTNAEFGDFTILVSNAPASLGNDACTGATSLSLNSARNGSTRFASGSSGAIGLATCSSAGDPDVWFSFRPTIGGPYEITATPDTQNDASLGLGVFVGCPSNLATDLACSGPLGPGSPNVTRFLATANTTYLIRASTYPGESSDFSIIVQPSTIALGACCIRDGGCFITGPDECTFFGGIYRGDNVACAGATCAPAGRCCFSGSSSCTITSQSACTGAGASFTAGGACDPVGCPAGTPPANDLCANAPTLTLPAEVLTGIDLADAEGPSIPAGFCGTTQSLDLGLDRSVYFRFVPPVTGTLNFDTRFVNFPEPMIVLYRGISCAQLVDVDCTYRFQAGEIKSFEVIGGQTYHLGLGIRNDPNFANTGGLIRFSLSLDAAQGACCRGNACTVELSNACAPSGAFQGAATACGAPGNPTTCCRANFNGLGGVTVQDVFDFLAAYFAAAPEADFNGIGGVTIQDIFDFLAAYFAGCA